MRRVRTPHAAILPPSPPLSRGFSSPPAVHLWRWNGNADPVAEAASALCSFCKAVAPGQPVEVRTHRHGLEYRRNIYASRLYQAGRSARRANRTGSRSRHHGKRPPIFGGGSSLRDSENVADAAANPSSSKSRPGEQAYCESSLPQSTGLPLPILNRATKSRRHSAPDNRQLHRKLSLAAAAGEIPPGSAILRVSP